MQRIVIDKLNEILKYIKKNDTSRYMDLKEIKDYTSLSKSTIRRRINSGNLKVSKSNGKIIAKISDVDNWLNG